MLFKALQYSARIVRIQAVSIYREEMEQLLPPQINLMWLQPQDVYFSRRIKTLFGKEKNRVGKLTF